MNNILYSKGKITTLYTGQLSKIANRDPKECATEWNFFF